MSILPQEIAQMLRCCISNNEHYAKDAILLPCGGNACKNCILDMNRKQECRCFNCNGVHKTEELRKMPINPMIGILIEKVYINDLVDLVKNEFAEIYNKIDGQLI